MPDMDGVEMFHRIKESGSGLNSNSVFIMLTAEDGSNVRENTLSEGFDDYMTKPFLPQVLEDIIKKHLQCQ
jgi:DNA-binding response OmpR family regulator